MEKRVKTWIREKSLLTGGETVLIALSGGCDSVGLLLCLYALRKDLDVRLCAAHINHGIRGAEAERDESFVRALCGKLSVPLRVFREEIPRIARESGESEEEAGRRIRYEDLCSAAKGFGAGAIATAHHRDDQAETFLLNLLRGSGPAGLAGMRWSRPVGGETADLRLIRPLLFLSRAEIETYVREKGEVWCEDSSNADGSYSRNRIRGSLLPEAERIRPGAAARIAAAAEKLRAAEDYLERETEKLYNGCGGKNGSLQLAALLALEPFMLQRVLARWLGDCGGVKDVGGVHYAALEKLIAGESGRAADLPGGRTILREQESLRLLCRDAREDAVPRASDFCLRHFPRENAGEIPQKQYTKWLDYDIIKGTLVFRTRQKGDYFVLPGGGKKSVKRYFIDEKIPLSERDRIPLAADGSHVLWIVGHRISWAARIGEKTKTILEITYGGSYGKTSRERYDR